MKYYINTHDVTALLWRAHANITFSPLSVLLFKLLICLLLLRRKRCALKRCVSLLLLRQNYSLALQRPTGQTALLQALALDQMRSNDYSTTEIFVDNCLLLSIMSTNHFSPIHNQTKRFETGRSRERHFCERDLFLSVTVKQRVLACWCSFAGLLWLLPRNIPLSCILFSHSL